MAMVDSFLDTAIRSGLELSEQEQNDYLLNMVEFADLVGVPRDDVPSTTAQLTQYFADILPELEATDDAKRAAIFLTLPPLPNLVRFATPAAPAWAGVSAIAAASLPRWARDLYGWPTLPGQETATNLSLYTLRKSLSLVPQTFIARPIFIEGKRRWNEQSVSA
jgi:uncharacterized protein (DUF2236 family)